MTLPLEWAYPGIYLLTFTPTGERYLGSAANVRARLQTHLSVPAHGAPGSGWRAKLMERGLSLEEIAAGSTPRALLLSPGKEYLLADLETELQVVIRPELNGHTGGRRGRGYTPPWQWGASERYAYLEARGHRSPCYWGREKALELVLELEVARLREKHREVLAELAA